jgi:hypothetical protein
MSSVEKIPFKLFLLILQYDHNHLWSFFLIIWWIRSAYMQPVVDAFDPRLLVAPAISHVLDFTEIKV